MDKLRHHFYLFISTIGTSAESIRFIRRHRLWDGFWKYGWVGIVLLILSFLLSLKIFQIAKKWWRSNHIDDASDVLANADSLFTSIASEGYAYLTSGGVKYLSLLLLEVVIFHMVKGTLEVLTGVEAETHFKAFVHAQIRMIKAVIRAYILEFIVVIVVKIILGIFGFLNFFGFIDLLENVSIYVVHSYFLGFVVFDNFTEQYGLPIKKSVKMARKYFGVVLGTGIIVNILLMVPIAGSFTASILASVTMTLVMYRLISYSEPEMKLIFRKEKEEQSGESSTDVL